MEAKYIDVTIPYEDKYLFIMAYRELDENKVAIPYYKIINNSPIYGELFLSIEDFINLINKI